MKAVKRFTPTAEQVRALCELPARCLPKILLEEQAYLREALAAVNNEIAELRAVGAPVEGAHQERKTEYDASDLEFLESFLF
jgi:hypothetical protein